MSDPYTGGCGCGEIRYTIASDPIFMNHCQCLQCQRLSGTGHGSYLTFNNEMLVLTGEPETRAFTGDSGNIKRHGICRSCNSPVTLTFDAMPALFTVTAASLDDPTRFAPQGVTYASRGHQWDMLDPALTRWDTMPGA